MSDLQPGAAPAPEAAVIDTNPPPAGAPEPAKVETSIDDTLSAAWDKVNVNNGSDRGENGRYESADPAKKELAAQPQTEKVEPVQPVQAAPTIEPPQSWTAEMKAKWLSLPPEHREVMEYAASRDKEAHGKIISQGERLKSLESVDQVISQFKHDLDRRGMQPAQAVAALFQAQEMLDRNFEGGVEAIGRTYGKSKVDIAAAMLGVDVNQLGALLSGQPVQTSARDPRVDQLEQRFAEQERERVMRETAEVNSQIESFKGDPSHPHFEAVRGLMGALMQSGQAKTLKDAYDMAVYAHPEIRQRIQEDQRIADEKKRKELSEKAEAEAKAKAEAASKSARVNVKGTTGNPTPKTMDDTLTEIARRHYG